MEKFDEYGFEVIENEDKKKFLIDYIFYERKSSLLNTRYSFVYNDAYRNITMVVSNNEKVLMIYNYENYREEKIIIKQKLQGVTKQEEEMYLTMLKLEA